MEQRQLRVGITLLDCGDPAVDMISVEFEQARRAQSAPEIGGNGELMGQTIDRPERASEHRVVVGVAPDRDSPA